eukprot:3388025-Prymnesium_polylepis.1
MQGAMVSARHSQPAIPPPGPQYLPKPLVSPPPFAAPAVRRGTAALLRWHIRFRATWAPTSQRTERANAARAGMARAPSPPQKSALSVRRATLVLT